MAFAAVHVTMGGAVTNGVVMHHVVHLSDGDLEEIVCDSNAQATSTLFHPRVVELNDDDFADLGFGVASTDIVDTNAIGFENSNFPNISSSQLFPNSSSSELRTLIGHTAATVSSVDDSPMGSYNSPSSEMKDINDSYEEVEVNVIAYSNRKHIIETQLNVSLASEVHQFRNHCRKPTVTTSAIERLQECGDSDMSPHLRLSLIKQPLLSSSSDEDLFTLKPIRDREISMEQLWRDVASQPSQPNDTVNSSSGEMQRGRLSNVSPVGFSSDTACDKPAVTSKDLGHNSELRLADNTFYDDLSDENSDFDDIEEWSCTESEGSAALDSEEANDTKAASLEPELCDVRDAGDEIINVVYSALRNHCSIAPSFVDNRETGGKSGRRRSTDRSRPRSDSRSRSRSRSSSSSIADENWGIPRSQFHSILTALGFMFTQAATDAVADTLIRAAELDRQLNEDGVLPSDWLSLVSVTHWICSVPETAELIRNILKGNNRDESTTKNSDNISGATPSTRLLAALKARAGSITMGNVVPDWEIALLNSLSETMRHHISSRLLLQRIPLEELRSAEHLLFEKLRNREAHKVSSSRSLSPDLNDASSPSKVLVTELLDVQKLGDMLRRHDIMMLVVKSIRAELIGETSAMDLVRGGRNNDESDIIAAYVNRQMADIAPKYRPFVIYDES